MQPCNHATVQPCNPTARGCSLTTKGCSPGARGCSPTLRGCNPMMRGCNPRHKRLQPHVHAHVHAHLHVHVHVSCLMSCACPWARWGITREELSRCDTMRIGACISAMFVSMAVQVRKCTGKAKGWPHLSLPQCLVAGLGVWAASRNGAACQVTASRR